MFSWTADLSIAERRAFAHELRPIYGEIIETPSLSIGILFLPRFADELMDPRARGESRQYLETAGLDAVLSSGARVVCLGGLLGALTGYGRRLADFATQHEIVVTTGHAMTATTIVETYARAVNELSLAPGSARMALLGVGSVGAAFARLLMRADVVRPAELVLIDKPERAKRTEELAAELARDGATVSVEFTSRDGRLDVDSSCFDSEYVISAVSTPEVIDIDRVAPRTVLIDDSQPNCWSREWAWRRVQRAADIAPCEAGLVDAASIAYGSAFPFCIAEMNGSTRSPVTFCCLAEGLLLALDPTLPPTVGEPALDGLLRHYAAFETHAFRAGRLQCGMHFLPLDRLRATFAGRREFVREMAPENAAGAWERVAVLSH
jgi:predicted amino acid dehydrogenase